MEQKNLLRAIALMFVLVLLLSAAVIVPFIHHNKQVGVFTKQLDAEFKKERDNE